MLRYGVYDCPLGKLVIGWEAETVVSLKLTDCAVQYHCPSPVSDLAAQQIAAYLAGIRREFDFPVSLSGTPFQMKVWDALLRIPYGETRTYGEIAASIGNPKAARAVGQAANCNPIWIAIPCHRVVGTNRNLTGYAGGLDMKQALLDLECSKP